MANWLTGLRLLLVAPVALAMARPEWLHPGWLLLMLVTAVLTDYFDGIVARKTGTSSNRGQFFDHATDFLFVTAGLTGAALAGVLPLLLPVLIVVAFTQYVLDSYLLYRQKALRMSRIGRWNGVLYFIPLFVVAASRLEILAAQATILSNLTTSLSYLLIISTILSILDRALAPLRSQETS